MKWVQLSQVVDKIPVSMAILAGFFHQGSTNPGAVTRTGCRKVYFRLFLAIGSEGDGRLTAA